MAKLPKKSAKQVKKQYDPTDIFSKAEIALLKRCNVELVDLPRNGEPTDLYVKQTYGTAAMNIVATRNFCFDAHSLGRVMVAVVTGKPPRGTEAFDSLIDTPPAVGEQANMSYQDNGVEKKMEGTISGIANTVRVAMSNGEQTIVADYLVRQDVGEFVISPSISIVKQPAAAPKQKERAKEPVPFKRKKNRGKE
jgi:hypothetical protein